MRILIVNEALSGAGGVESYLGSLVPALARRGHDVAFLHLRPRGERETDGLKDVVHCIGAATVGRAAALDDVRRFQPDVCFSHDVTDLDVDEALAREWPVVKMMHGYFGTCVGSQKMHGFPAPAPCSRALGAACLSLYLPRHCGQLRPVQMVRQYRWAVRQQRLLASYRHVVVASRHMAAEFARNGVPDAAITAAPLFPTIDAAGPRERPAVATVVSAGRLTTLKGGDVLLRAMARVRNLVSRPSKVIIAGAGPELDGLRKRAAGLGLDASFPGWVTGVPRIELLRSGTLFAMPSLWPEPFGLAGLEAAALGVPAVAFDAGGISEWLRDGVNGRLVRPHGSAEALGRAIADLVNAPDELARLEQGARAVAAELSIDAHVAAVERVLAGAARPIAYAT